MSYTTLQTRIFSRKYNKLQDNVASDVDLVVETVAAQPTLDECKKGDLAALLVYKFRSQGKLYLLGYTVDNGVKLVYLEAIVSPENCDLKH
jgi:hypothetical protein